MDQAHTILLTGGSSGIGRAASSMLAQRGYRFLLTSRSADRAAAVADQLRATVPGARVTGLPLDLASTHSVRGLAARLRDERIPVRTIVHNAGTLRAGRTRRLTADGVETTLATNALGPFLLTHELLPELVATGAGRIVSVSSRLHAPGTRGRPVGFDLDDPHMTRGFHPDRAYKNSKLALLWFHRELARRAARLHLPLVCVAVCPGFVAVTAAAGTRGPQRFLLERVLPRFPFVTSLQDAAATLVAAALGDTTEPDRMLSPDGGVDLSADARDPERAERFWDLACRVVDVDPWP